VIPPQEEALHLGPDVLRDVPRAARKEWLLADGLGGYASSTVLGLNTRRYHGLLVVARNPPVDRMVLLSRLEETLVVGGERYELGVNAYPGTLHPRGFEFAASFTLDPLPTLVYEVGGCRLTRTLARIHGAPTVIVTYLFEGPENALLEVRPLLAYRDHHALQHENGAINPSVGDHGEDLVLEPYAGSPKLFLRLRGAQWRTDGLWYRRLEYAEERNRGFDFHEDLFSHGSFRCPMAPGEEAGLVVSTNPVLLPGECRTAMDLERVRLRSLAQAAQGRLGSLRRAADAFVVTRGETGRTVVAGYHWFTDWGRDTMISLPGLCVATGRDRDARTILREFARHVDGGMIPNCFPDEGGAPEYNTVDAALWMVLAIRSYLEATGDQGFVLGNLRGAVESILKGYRAGTRHGIRMTDDGLITQGGPGLQLTWMDARVSGRPITPRTGKPVEIQALWFNALHVGAELATAAGDGPQAALWTRLAAECKKSFRDAFWWRPGGYLADCVGEAGEQDASLRPNQLYAIGLPHSLLSRADSESVLAVVERDLLTPVGLRTLAPVDPSYQGRYEGGPEARDGAYHQGTVWPYLMGIYFDTLIRLRGEAGKHDARAWLEAFSERQGDYGLGFVGEVFGGDAPHPPGGAIAQAWSVAEILRIETRLAGRRGAVRP
jgi:predicted glycogen debranching enzyme